MTKMKFKDVPVGIPFSVERYGLLAHTRKRIDENDFSKVCFCDGMNLLDGSSDFADEEWETRLEQIVYISIPYVPSLEEIAYERLTKNFNRKDEH